MHTKTWRVDLFIAEKDGRTHTDAVLVTDGSAGKLYGSGSARRNPRDTEVPEIGEELATARALADLAHQLLETSAADIEAVTSKPAELTH